MRREFEGHLDSLACKVAHAARKDARRKAQLGDKTAFPCSQNFHAHRPLIVHH